jgi:hypothetical protein
MPNPEVLYLVDSYGIAIQDQMMGPLLFSGGNFGLVLREHLEPLAAQHETSPSEMQRMLCFDGAKMRFSLSEGILKRDRKRSSPELSEAAKVNKNQKKKKANEDEAAYESEVVMDKGTRASAKLTKDCNKDHGDASGAGPVKKKMESIFASHKKLSTYKDINRLKDRLFEMSPFEGFKTLQMFEGLLATNKAESTAAKAQLFVQSLDTFTAPKSPSALALASSPEETATGQKRKRKDQDAKSEKVAAAAESGNKKVKTEDDKTADKQRRPELLNKQILRISGKTQAGDTGELCDFISTHAAELKSLTVSTWRTSFRKLLEVSRAGVPQGTVLLADAAGWNSDPSTHRE